MAANLYHGDLLAEERHSGSTWGWLILAAVLVPAISVAIYPTGPARWTLAFVAVLAGIGVAMAWGGFQYRFLRQGVEIRMLGFVLRTIPKEAIVSYSIEPWSIARGYGIRGMGSTRAYVWVNKVVHIRTTNGEIFLGHNEPERVVRDLNLVTGFVTRG